MKIRSLLVLVLTLFSLAAHAQEGGVKGRVVTRVGRAAISGIKVVLEPSNRVTYTENDGMFEFRGLVAGDYTLKFEGAGEFEGVVLNVKVGDTMKDINLVPLASAQSIGGLDDSVFNEFDMELADDAQSVPSSLSASKDIFNNIAGYKFSEMRFRNRGYDSEHNDIYLNGVRFNDALTGYGSWSLWTGLNDATRNQEATPGLGVSEYGVGGVGGITNINARASQMRKGFRSSVVNANRQYRFRVMLTYASGMLDNGWSYAFSASTRQGGNDWVNGIWYNTWAYFASVEKQLNLCHRFAFTFMGTPTERSVQAASTQEVYDLVGSNYYNANWGWQGDKKRNARVRNYHEPVAILNYYYEPNLSTRLTATASFRFGRNGYSALDWYDSPDPRPDYYRYLPSYFETDYAKAWAEQGWKSDWDIRQISWRKMYDANYNRSTSDALANRVPGLTPSMRRATYVIEERHTDQRDLNLKVQLMRVMRGGHRINAGIDFRYNRTEYYKKMKDLLGGDYWYDVDKYAERDFPGEREQQTDLKYFDKYGHARVVRKGDKYGYDYYAHVRDLKGWAVYDFNAGRFEGFVAGEVGYTGLWRQGLFQKGTFEHNSYGDSKKQNFFTFTAKGGVSYRISGAHTLGAQVAYVQEAPSFQSSFVSPRTRNSITPGLETQKIFAADLSYDLRLGGFKGRVSAYLTTIRDASKVISFYDDIVASYTNFAMSGIDKRHMGLEVGFTVPLYGGLNLNGALSYGKFTYTSNPSITQTEDNSAEVKLQNEKVYWKGYHVESTPQTALNLGLSYRSSNNIFASVDLNYYDAMYLSMNPLYRTDGALIGRIFDSNTPEENKKAVEEITHQERFDHAFVLNASVGKNWFLGPNRKYMLGFSLEVKNILNDQDIKTGGYEQMRLHKDETGATLKYTRFDSKYFYMFGTTYYMNIYFRF